MNCPLEKVSLLPDIQFYVVGFGWEKSDDDNLHYVPFITDSRKKYEFFREMSMLIYIPLNQHIFGPPLGVTSIEFLQMGRYVIRNASFPHTLFAKDYNDIKEIISTMRTIKESNIEGSDYYIKKYNYNVFKNSIEKLLEGIKCARGNRN